jgi:shikimate dehydrogenase
MIMSSSEVIGTLQNCITNSLAAPAASTQCIAGIIGDAPSHYSKSPRLWNAAFQRFGIDAVYLPFDVTEARVAELLAVLKSSERFLGVNVTVPHKVRVMKFLDEIGPEAERIHAVNTIVRTRDGRLVGYNTDGAGFIESVLTRQPDRVQTFIPSLKGMDVLLLGAGGSARAVAFHVADLLDGGRLLICNRTIEHAASLADDLNRAGGNAEAIREANVSNYAPNVGLIVNSTTKGQGGLRSLSHDTVTLLEGYSSLAPANPPAFSESDSAKPDFQRKWLDAANADIQANNQSSLDLAKSIPPQVGFYDLIYHPEETVFLKHGRLTGHPTMNGKAMIVNQAVIAFCKHICRKALQEKRTDTAETRRELLEVMYQAW